MRRIDEKKRVVFICQSNYIPWKGYFDAINMADVFVLYDDVQYTRRDWRNRNIIKTPTGLKWLTIPIEVKGKFTQTIREAVVSERDWNQRHWKTIQANYAKAPFFKEYKGLFEELYLECRETSLSGINHRFLTAICGLLGIKTEFRSSSDFDLKGDPTERLLNICKDLRATEYLSGPAAKHYLRAPLFGGEGIQVRWLAYSGYRPYVQLFGEFEHRVSIIDLIFNMGPATREYMTKTTCQSIDNENMRKKDTL